MKLSEALTRAKFLYLSGPIETRLKFDFGITEPAWKLIGSKDENALKEILAQDIALAQAYNANILIPATTFRASRNHIPATGSVEDINQAAVDFVITLTNEKDPTHATVITSAAIGSMHSAYSVESIPSVEEARAYHSEQINILSETNIDLINAITLPSLNEARGIAQALAATHKKEYLISFILNDEGHLLDGTPLHTAIHIIDEDTSSHPPLGYMIFCTHPSTMEKVPMDELLGSRLLGIKANASMLPLKQKETLAKAIADEPEMFATDLHRLSQRLNFRILGGCCGTSLDHLKAIISKTSPHSAIDSTLLDSETKSSNRTQTTHGKLDG